MTATPGGTSEKPRPLRGIDGDEVCPAIPNSMLMPYHGQIRAAVATLGLFAAGPPMAGAGGGPQNVLLVVNDNSRRSLAVGQYYREQRGLHGRQVLHVTTTTNPTVSTAAFSNELRNPVQDYLAGSGLSNQVDFVVFGPDLPYRVEHTNGHMNGITAAMFYDFKDYVLGGSCPQLGDAESSYYEAELSVGGQDGVLSTVLTAWNSDEARRLVDRSVRADGTSPTATVYYVHVPDSVRAIRWPRFENAAFSLELSGSALRADILLTDKISNETNVMGYMLGRIFVPGINQNHYAEGALGDHLTSFGGYLTDPAGQMSILEWIHAGTAGSYGTVVEPCAFTNKFPDARLYYWYGRGFNMAESYWMSVQHPYQGVFVGDPLCAPYARPPAVAIGGISGHELVSGSVSMTFTGRPSSASGLVQRLDLYIDDLRIGTLTNAVPAPNDKVVVNIIGTSTTYAIQSGDTLPDVAQGVSDALNAIPALGLTASASGDRVQLVQDQVGVPGTGITYSASIITTNALPSLSVQAAGSHFVESRYAPRQRLTVRGTVDPGDMVQLVVTNLDGLGSTNFVVASATNTLDELMTTLTNLVNQDAVLTGSSGCYLDFLRDTAVADEMEVYLIARTNTWEGANLGIAFSTVGLDGDDYAGPVAFNAEDITARGVLYLSVGLPELVAHYDLDSTGLANGPHTVRAVVLDGTAVEVQGHALVPFAVSNHSLTCSITNPSPPSGLWLGDTGSVTVAATVAAGTVTSVSLYVEGKLQASTNAPPFTFAWPTDGFGAGLVELQAEAFSSSSDRSVSDPVQVRVRSDVDGDGMPDAWEYLHFGGETNADASADADGDGTDHLAEYIADTQPHDSNSLFLVTAFTNALTGSMVDVSFVSSTERRYLIEYNEDVLLDPASWAPVSPDALPGGEGSSHWSVNTTTNRSHYRVRAQTP